MNLVLFSLESDLGRYARFPFFMHGEPASPSENRYGISCAISFRSAGEMGFDPDRHNANRLLFFSELGLPAERVAARKQTHSKDVLPIGADQPLAALPSGDGLAANDPALVLSVTVADCLPVFLSDGETGAFSLLHSGWKGTGIVLTALSVMRERWGTKPERVSAVLGPCIRGCCYEVDAGRAAAFEAEFGPICAGKPLGPAVRRAGARSFIDLQAANAALLETAGVEDIAVCRDCTFTDDRLGSFRREGSDRFTRMVALLGRLP
jgi:YfiH family protein